MNWSKNNYHAIRLGLVKQWKWFCISLNTEQSFNFTFFCWFFGIGVNFYDLYLLPTIQCFLPKKYNSFEDERINILWLNFCFTINIGNILLRPFKGYVSKEKVESYKLFLKKMM